MIIYVELYFFGLHGSNFKMTITERQVEKSKSNSNKYGFCDG